MFVLGGTIGEALLPIIIGQLMKALGQDLFSIVTVIMTAAMIALYTVAHFLLACDRGRAYATVAMRDEDGINDDVNL